MQPVDETEIIEDAENFLRETLGFNPNENFELSDGFKSFPPIQPLKKKKKKRKGLRFDVQSRIKEVSEEGNNEVSGFSLTGFLMCGK